MSRRKQVIQKLPRIREGDRPRAGSRRRLAWLATWLADRRRERQSPGVPVPNAPSNVAASPDDGFIIVLWQDNASDEAGFRIYRKAFSGSYSVLGECAPNLEGYGDFSAEPGVLYTYYVVAFNAGGESARSNESSASLEGGA
jgi:hypothetical protein